jgi:hypothetical protein
MTMSISGASISAEASSRTCVAAVLAASANERGGVTRGFPSGARERRMGSRGIEVGDADHMNARRVLRLREVHRAEFASADQPDSQRATFGAARAD